MLIMATKCEQQLSSKNKESREDRIGTEVQEPAEIKNDSKNEMDERQELFEYGFGIPFSYWKEWTFYEYIQAKYKDLKEEILNNTICKLEIEEYTKVNDKVEKLHGKIQSILGKEGDKNTAYAKYDQQFNQIFNIPKDEIISKKHLCSILFYTDFSQLPQKMKSDKLSINWLERTVSFQHHKSVNASYWSSKIIQWKHPILTKDYRFGQRNLSVQLNLGDMTLMYTILDPKPVLPGSDQEWALFLPTYMRCKKFF